MWGVDGRWVGMGRDGGCMRIGRDVILVAWEESDGVAGCIDLDLRARDGDRVGA